ncbi:MAG: YraN family protein [Candidimonas sp.]|nr:MAG: YraN family protein [Candidimonas sp.]
MHTDDERYGGEELAYRLAARAQQDAVRARTRRAARTARPRQPRAGASPRQKLGSQAEARASRHLQAAGAIVLARNLRCRSGEIDLIILDRGTLAFVEVRYRGSDRYGGAAASVNQRKQQRLIRAARFFLPAITRRHFPNGSPPCRFDVIALGPGTTQWLKQAFAQTG